MNVNYNELGKRIAKRRRELGIKQSEVNELAGLSDKYLSNIERATSIPSIEVLMKICAVLKTTPDYLLLGTNVSGDPNDLEMYIICKLRTMSSEQVKMVISFLDWAAEQKT